MLASICVCVSGDDNGRHLANDGIDQIILLRGTETMLIYKDKLYLVLCF